MTFMEDLLHPSNDIVTQHFRGRTSSSIGLDRAAGLWHPQDLSRRPFFVCLALGTGASILKYKEDWLSYPTLEGSGV